MRYVSYHLDGEDRVGRLVHDLVHPLVGIDRIDHRTTAAALASAPVDEGAGLPFSQLRLLPASPEPRRVVCVGLNYRDHIAETRRSDSDYPVLFGKFASSLIGARDPILLPPEPKFVDYEGELAVIIGKTGRRIAPEDAMGHVLGYAVANDITMRDYQYKTHQWMQGKAWDASTPLGPVIVTPDEVQLDSCGIRTYVNGRLVQDSDLGHLIFSIPTLISTVSEFTTLQPGDVILTGTPGGVGYRRDPQLALQAGDTVVVDIDGVGRIESAVVAEEVGAAELIMTGVG